MHYLILTRLEYPSSISLKLAGLTSYETHVLSEKFTEDKVNFSIIEPNHMEINLAGYQMLNILAKTFGYRVVGQAMAMQLTSLGGRSFQIEKIVWTLEQQD
ncbi:uncharacterized protein LOC143915828 [Arctopsyche grandis]|uniref:uncharacterized protein LOC143915828 n=1 Tax=Arctopsyche grandis TaxID=121162 RepID=UPI00406D909D